MEKREQSLIPLNTLRSRLSKMTDRIIFRLHDRSGFPVNPSIYQPDEVPISGKSGISFLEFAVQGLEQYHATLGRYEYPDQHPIISTVLPPTGATRRLIGLPPLPNVQIGLKDQLIPFYRDTVIPQLCEPGDQPDTYGETAFLDADVLELLNERINIGRYVARSKAQSDPSILDIVSDSNELLKRLRDSNQEERVIGSVRSAANRYGLGPDKAELVFRWVIEQTIGLEVTYLQGMPRDPQ